MAGTIAASAYLVVKGYRSRYYGNRDPKTGLTSIEKAKITEARQGRPAKLGPDEVLIKVTVQLPSAVFDPITPQALIVVPEDMVLDRHELEVQATEDGEDR